MTYRPGDGAIGPDSCSIALPPAKPSAPQGNELTQLYETSSYQVLSHSYKSVQVVERDIKFSGR